MQGNGRYFGGDQEQERCTVSNHLSHTMGGQLEDKSLWMVRMANRCVASRCRERSMAEPFERLVPKRDYPDYYRLIKSPMALDIIEVQGLLREDGSGLMMWFRKRSSSNSMTSSPSSWRIVPWFVAISEFLDKMDIDKMDRSFTIADDTIRRVATFTTTQ